MENHNAKSNQKISGQRLSWIISGGYQMSDDEIIKAYSETVKAQTEIIESLGKLIEQQSELIAQLYGVVSEIED